MLDDHGHHLLDIDGMKFQIMREGLRGLPARHVGVVLDLLDQAEEALVGGVVLKHVHDEAFLDGLPHGVVVEGRLAGRARLVEQGHGLELRRGREGEEAEVRLPRPFQRVAQHGRLGLVGQVVVLFVGELGGDGGFDPFTVQHALERRRGLAALGRVRLVDDDGEAFSRGVDLHGGALFLKGRERLRDEGKLLDGGDDDGRALGQRRGELLRVLVDLLDHAGLVLELVDRVLQLLIEHAPVGDDDDGVKHLLVALVVQAGQTVSEPGDRVRLAGAGGMLNQVVASGAVGLGVGDEFADRVELMIAREDHCLLACGARAVAGPAPSFLRFEVHEALQDLDEAVRLQNLVP